MSHIRTSALAAALAAVTSACTESTGPGNDLALTTAFASVLLGYDNVQSSFSGGPGAGGVAWAPGGAGHRGGPGHGAMSGGGLGGLFLGGGFGAGFGRGRHGDPSLPDSCAFVAASGRVTCDAVERNGLTILRSAAYTDASGAIQSAFDSLTTNTINVRVAVSGTTTRRNGAISTVEHASDRTVAGNAAGSTQRTINGTSTGSEYTTGTNEQGNFTALRIMGDTISNVIVPVQSGTATYPTSGSVIRTMQVTITIEGQAPITSTRREVVTYNGSHTAQVVITRDGATRNCTLPLPHGRITCQ